MPERDHVGKTVKNSVQNHIYSIYLYISNVGLEIPAIQQPAGIRCICSDTKFVFVTDTCTIIYIYLFIISPHIYREPGYHGLV